MQLLAEAPNWADITSALGQAAGALFTAAAVWVALRLAARDRREIRDDRRTEAKGRAAMVIAHPQDSDVVITNHGAAPIRRVELLENVIPGDPAITWTPQGRSRIGMQCEVLAAGGHVVVAGAFTRSTPIPGQDAVSMHIYDRDRPPPGAVSTIRFIDAEGHTWTRRGLEDPKRGE